MIIETERLVLREMNMDDYDSLYAVLGDSDIMQHYPHPFNEEMVRKWIESNRERYKTFGFGLWAVCLKENNEMKFYISFIMVAFLIIAVLQFLFGKRQYYYLPDNTPLKAQVFYFDTTSEKLFDAIKNKNTN